MALTLQTPIDTARTILNDVGDVAYTEADLLRYANDALDAIVGIAPQYFFAKGEITCVEGEVRQAAAFVNTHSLVSVDRVKAGNALTMTDKAALDAFNPAWPTDTAGAAVHWMPNATSPVLFYIYPKAPANQILEVTYVTVPGEYTAVADTGLPMTLAPAIADYIVALAMARDDEHVNAGRSQQFMASFAGRIKGA